LSSKFRYQIALRTYEHAFHIRNTHASIRFTWGTYGKIVWHNNHTHIYSLKWGIILTFNDQTLMWLTQHRDFTTKFSLTEWFLVFSLQTITRFVPLHKPISIEYEEVHHKWRVVNTFATEKYRKMLWMPTKLEGIMTDYTTDSCFALGTTQYT